MSLFWPSSPGEAAALLRLFLVLFLIVGPGISGVSLVLAWKYRWWFRGRPDDHPFGQDSKLGKKLKDLEKWRE